MDLNNCTVLPVLQQQWGVYIPCLRLLTPSAGSGEGALSLVEDMVGEAAASTSFPVQTNHCPALFCGSVIHEERSRHAAGKRIAVLAEQSSAMRRKRKSSESLAFRVELRLLPGTDSRGCGGLVMTHTTQYYCSSYNIVLSTFINVVYVLYTT